MHEKYSELLQSYLDGESELLEKILLEEHLSYCHSCRAELNQLKLLDWELKHPHEIEVPAELAIRRREVLNNQLAAEYTEEKEFAIKDVWRFQVQIIKHASGFVSKSPVNRTINHTVKGSLSFLGKAAGTSLKKRNPVLGRLFFGQT